MCEQQANGFVMRLIQEMQGLIAMRPEVGSVHVNRVLPPRLETPPEEAIVNAIGTTICRLRQEYPAVLPSDEFLEAKMTPKAVAEMIVQAAIDLSHALAELRPCSCAENLGSARVYFFLLNAVLALFFDKLAGKVNTAEFAENIRKVREMVDLIATQEMPSQEVH